MRFLILFLFSSICFGQNENYSLQGHLIGKSLSGQAHYDNPYMSDIIKIGPTYYMYFATQPGDATGQIMYATSTDAVNWIVKDTILSGVNDTNDREYFFGGPRVVKIADSTYRMFYRCSPKEKAGKEPELHLRSAISSDGINFTKEGIVIDNGYNVTDHYFTHVGHSAFYHDLAGTLRALLTGKDTTYGPGVPDNLYTAISLDSGKTWSNFNLLYEECHDPVVVRDSSGVWRAYFTYLNTGFKTASSLDGVNWQVTPDELTLFAGSDTLRELADTTKNLVKIADLGAFVLNSGDVVITSNYVDEKGAWNHIAYYYKDIVTALSTTTKKFASLTPNPASTSVYLQSSDDVQEVRIFNSSGVLIKTITGKNTTHLIDVSQFSTGIYYFIIRGSNDAIQAEKVVVN